MLRAPLLALRRLFGSPWKSATAVGVVAAALCLVFSLRLVRENFVQLAAGWVRGAQMIIYLDDTTTPARARQIADTIAKLPSIERVTSVEPREAHARLRRSLGDRAGLLDGVEETMLPTSIEVTVKEGLAEVARLRPLFERLKRVPGVEEIEVLGDLVNPLRAIERWLRMAGFFIGLVAALASIAAIAAATSLRLARHGDEISTYRLLGATWRFVLGPFLIEGALEGALGVSLGLGGALLLYRKAAPAIQHALGATLSAAPIHFLPLHEVVLALCAGVAIGLAGSLLAARRVARG